MLAKNSLFNHNKRLQAKTKKELTSNGQALFNSNPGQRPELIDIEAWPGEEAVTQQTRKEQIRELYKHF